MEILTEFDELQAALAKVNMNESVLPYVNGRLVSDQAFNKSQKILNCPEMISAHKYIYELDMDQLTEEDEDKIDQLYKLGVDRGFIIDDLTKWDDEGNVEEPKEDIEIDITPPEPKNTLFKAKVPCWTVIYSATKDGDIKTGEAYSNAVSMSAAKADVNAKLSQCGYENISILAIENCTNAPVANVYADNISGMNEADDEDDAAADDSGDDSSDEGSDEDSGDDSGDDSGNEDAGDDSGDEEGSDEDSGDELSDSDKKTLKNEYKKIFTDTLVKCKFDKPFNELTLDEKVKFFTELSKAWTKDNDPTEFMTDTEREQLDSIKAEGVESDSEEEDSGKESKEDTEEDSNEDSDEDSGKESKEDTEEDSDEESKEE